ncbi:MAG: flippase [Thermodesulforhabdaceae bacterium]|jgi:O-antigen/teichoic acid export membrane protein
MIRFYATNMIAQTLGRSFSIVAQVLVFVLIARRFGAEALGQYAYFLTFVNVCATFADFGSTVTMAKDLPRFEGEKRELYLGNVIIIRGVLAFLVMIFALAVVPFLGRDLLYILIIGVITIPFAASRFFDPVFQILEKPWYASISTGLYGISFVLFSIPLILFDSPLWTLCVAYLVAQIFYLVLAWLLTRSLIKPRFVFNRDLCITHLKIAIPIGISFIFTAINSRADTFLLEWMRGVRDVGMYNAVYKVVDTAALFAVLTTNPLIPILSQKKQQGMDHFTKTLFLVAGLFVGFLIPIALATPLFSEWFVALVYGESFREAAQALNVLSWVCMLIFVGLLASTACLVMDVVHFEWWNAAVAAALNITINLFLIPVYGYLGSAWATLASEIWIVSVTIFFMIRAIGKVKIRLL